MRSWVGTWGSTKCNKPCTLQTLSFWGLKTTNKFIRLQQPLIPGLPLLNCMVFLRRDGCVSSTCRSLRGLGSKSGSIWFPLNERGHLMGWFTSLGSPRRLGGWYQTTYERFRLGGYEKDKAHYSRRNLPIENISLLFTAPSRLLLLYVVHISGW